MGNVRIDGVTAARGEKIPKENIEYAFVYGVNGGIGGGEDS